MKTPESISERASELGFEICGWDEACGAIRGLPTSPYGQEQFIGSHEEIRAYLTGFANCRRFELLEIEKLGLGKDPAPSLRRSVIGLRAQASHRDRVVTAYSRPHVAFRGERIAIPDEIAGSFDVIDIRIGNRSQFLYSHDVSATLFAARIDRQASMSFLHDGALTKLIVSNEAQAEFGRPLSMDTCQPQMDITIVAKLHEDASPMMFEAIVLGRTIAC